MAVGASISPNASGLAGETLTLGFQNPDSTNGGGADSYLAMDNLTFSTMIVPEPATAVLAGWELVAWVPWQCAGSGNR